MTGVSDQIPEGLTLNTICKFGGELSSCFRTEEWKRFFNSDRVLLKVCWGLEIVVGSARHFLAGLPLLAIPAALVHSSTFDAVLIFSVWPMRPINSATSNPYQMTSLYEVYVLTLSFWTYWKTYPGAILILSFRAQMISTIDILWKHFIVAKCHTNLSLTKVE